MSDPVDVRDADHVRISTNEGDVVRERIVVPTAKAGKAGKILGTQYASNVIFLAADAPTRAEIGTGEIPVLIVSPTEHTKAGTTDEPADAVGDELLQTNILGFSLVYRGGKNGEPS